MVITLLPPANMLNGKTLEDFVKTYWQDLCPIPKSNNPAWQNDGSKDRSFNNSINEDLYMLSFSRDPQTQVYRRIDDFPRNKGIFIPLMSVIVSKCETTQNLTNVASLDQSSIDTPTLELELDLNLLKLGDINRYRINAGQIKEFD